ncbi:MAG TPA: hypothetical protein PLM53_07695 [Spirochaetota bacterium]|nr:hypothetical protein [Spirochaetota bacterium]HPC41239.1 hypothetical protein [Spirochaetota bacterium]HPL15722.1 hypothetical protein [Spirochaetota bacterium]HQF08149.1 hypothetical protein [Spirochaetota bacterium]HQH96964.1 hypothetical protein [Spirochaetota bacterium]
MKFNTYFLDMCRRTIVFPVIIIDDEDLYSARDMAQLKHLLLRCRQPYDRFIKFIDATGYEFLFEPPVMALIPNVLRQQSFPWKKKEIYRLYQEAPNRPCEVTDPQKLLKKPIGDIIIHLAGLVKDNRPSLAGRLARPFRKRRPFDPRPWLH